MSVGIPYHNCLLETQLHLLIRHHARRNKGGLGQPAHGSVGVWRNQDRLPVDDVVCMFIGWERASITGSEVFQQLNARAVGGAQCCDPQMRAEDVIEMLLL